MNFVAIHVDAPCNCKNGDCITSVRAHPPGGIIVYLKSYNPCYNSYNLFLKFYCYAKTNSKFYFNFVSLFLLKVKNHGNINLSFIYCVKRFIKASVNSINTLRITKRKFTDYG